MYASPGVAVNGAKPLAHEVLPGQVVEIPANDSLELQPGGDQVKLEPRSSAAYINRRQIELRNGTITILTKTGIAVHVHQYMVIAVAAYSRYQVSWANEGGRVWVYEGEVRIDGCEKKLSVLKHQIAELGRVCKLGAYLRPPGGSAVDVLGLAVPAVPVLCYYRCPSCESGKQLNEKNGCKN